MKKIKAFPLLALTSAMLFSLSSCNLFKSNKFKKTRIAVFADNQLSMNNGGNTQLSQPFLKNHLKLCKEKNVDVIMISGDLANNAFENCYAIFEDALKEIYGKNEENYPEFVCTMGNHEWYDENENVDKKAITLFNKHARIDTKTLRKRSETEAASQSKGNYTDYYKVINGIPFLSISGADSSGFITSFQKEEISGWLKEIKKLPSIKKGGPMFVGYHYALKGITYGTGQGSTEHSEAVIDLLKDFPQAIVFTGDTHFSGANERTINQVDFTNINLGSSSYSRHVSKSATMDKYTYYMNVSNSHQSKDVLIGDVADNFWKTPHIHIVDVNDKYETIINRYFSTSDPTAPTKLGLEWKIPAKVTKDQFIYTNERFQNKEWAQKMYGKDGLSWDLDAVMTFTNNSSGLTVNFPDVTDYNYCEHYKIRVETIGNEVKDYDYVSHYYKWEAEAHTYSFTINKEDLPEDEITGVKVMAYDFFDNPSINSLSSN